MCTVQCSVLPCSKARAIYQFFLGEKGEVMKFCNNVSLQLYAVDPFTCKRPLNIVKASPLVGHILFLVLFDTLFGN